MYIEKIRLKDVRCFDEVSIDLSEARPGTSILIAGNNGIGKSAVLRAIAMGLCDRDSAASLLRELEGNFIRRAATRNTKTDFGDRRAEIEIQLVDIRGERWTIVTEIEESDEFIIERVSQHYSRTSKRKTNFGAFAPFWDDLFVAAYGAGLRTAGNAKFSDYFPPDAVYSLFKYDAPLQDPEIAWRRLVAAAQSASKTTQGATRRVHREISSLLKYVLNLDDRARILLAPNGIYVDDGQGSIPLDALGDGHKSLVKVTLDILVWSLLKINYDKYGKGDARAWRPIPMDSRGRPSVRGIVIIDEVEQHLHPKLQRQVLTRLREKFPRVQFIVTTHSPLCVSGAAEHAGSKEEFYRVFSLRRIEERVAITPMASPRGLRADQILLDYFDLPTTLNAETEALVRELDHLIALPATKQSPTHKRRAAALLKALESLDFSLAEEKRDRAFQTSALAYLRRKPQRSD